MPENKQPVAIADTASIHNLDLSRRISNALARADIETIADLTDVSENELRDLPTIGGGAIREIIAALSRHGRTLRPTYQPGKPLDHDRPRGQNPVNAPKCGDYGHKNRLGDPCGANAIKGTEHCFDHAGVKKSIHRARGIVRIEVEKWGLGDTKVDPGETLLRLVSQSATRVDMLSRALGEAYEAADRIRVAHEAQQFLAVDGVDEEATASELAARADLERIFSQGGIAALVGHTYTATQAGGIYATGEAIRGLAQLEAQERDRLAGFCAKAIAAGLAERQVRMAEQLGGQLARVVRHLLDGLGLAPEQWELVPARMAEAAQMLQLVAA